MITELQTSVPVRIRRNGSREMPAENLRKPSDQDPLIYSIVHDNHLAQGIFCSKSESMLILAGSDIRIPGFENYPWGRRIMKMLMRDPLTLRLDEDYLRIGNPVRVSTPHLASAIITGTMLGAVKWLDPEGVPFRIKLERPEHPQFENRMGAIFVSGDPE